MNATNESEKTSSQDRRSRQRLWVVGEVYYPEETSTGFYMTAIAEGLADDFCVKALCGQPNYSLKGVTAPRHEIHNNVEIFRASGTRLDKNVIAFRIVNMITLGISSFVLALRKFQRGDQILVVTTPPILPFIAAVAALLRGASYTPLIHDCYPEQLIAVGSIGARSAAARVLNFFNRWLYKHAQKLIVVGRDMRELIERKTAGLDVKIVIIPNWAENESVGPTPRESNLLLKDLGIQDKFVFMHAGNIGRPTDVETIIETATMLKNDDRFRFVFVGSGVKKGWMQTQLRERGLNNIVMLEPRPRSDQIEFLNACDVGLVSLVDGMLGAAMPSKTYNIMAAGKPILAICDTHSELARVIDEERIGWHVAPGIPDLLVQTIIQICANRDELGQMGTRARRAAETKYDLNCALDKYRQELGNSEILRRSVVSVSP